MRSLPIACAVAVLGLAAGCGGNSSTASAPVTVTVTVTATPSAGDEPTAPVTEDTATAIPPAPGPLPDPCTLLTQQEAEQLAGSKLDPPDDVGAAGGDKTLCQRTGPVTGPTVQVSVFVGDGAEKQYHIDKDTLGHDFTTLTGVGDEAYLEDGWVFVHVGSTWASVNFVNLESDQSAVNKRMTAVAHILASRL